MLNYWMSYKDTLVCWQGIIPEPFTRVPFERLLDFYHQLLVAGREEEVYLLPALPGVEGDPVEAEMTHVRDKLQRKQELPDIHWNGKARLCYWDEQAGDVVEQVVESPGTLLRTLYPDKIERYGYRYMYPWEAVHIYTSLSLFRRHHPFEVDISLFSDIWFPSVEGVIPYGESDQYETRFEDNSELALCHTPRFNRFLAVVRELTLALGGTWERLVGGYYGFYVVQTDEMGIILPQFNLISKDSR